MEKLGREGKTMNRICSAWFATLIIYSASCCGQWISGPPLPAQLTERSHGVGINDNGTLYSIGGPPWTNMIEDGSVHQLLPSGTAWNPVSPLGGIAAFIFQGGGIDALGRIVIFGGELISDPTEPPPGPFTYEPIDGPAGGLALRSVLAPFARFAWCTDAQNRIYSLGGGLGAGGTNSAYCERYNGLTNTWEVIAPMNQAVADATSASDGSHVLVFGGFNGLGTARVTNVALYDIATNTWSDTAVPDMPVALTGARAVVGADGRFYVIGGTSGPVGIGTTQNTCYVLEADFSTWSVGPPLTSPRQWFTAVLGDDHNIYVLGGENNTGNITSVEKLVTHPCPTITVEPIDQSAWAGSVAGFHVESVGGDVITYSWQRNGTALSDGLTPHGSQIVGSMTGSLTIINPAVEDQGLYLAIASNSCGSTPSTQAFLQVQTPASIGTQWQVVNLHPDWGLTSRANGIDGGIVTGHADTTHPTYGILNQAVVWMDDSNVALNLTPGNSVGSVGNAIANGVVVGWWWQPYQCNLGQTCYFKSASIWEWTGAGWVHTDPISMGEYNYIRGTDGSTHAGYGWSDWPAPSQSIIWYPTGGLTIVDGGVATVDTGGVVYGSLFDTATRAARWNVLPNVSINLSPPKTSQSYISGAGDHQQVGTARLNTVDHAWLFAGVPFASKDLSTPTTSPSYGRDCEQGIQVGQATINAVTHAVLWQGTASSMLDLHQFAPASFAYSVATGIDLSPLDGTLRVVGYGFNEATGRTEALLWINGNSACPSDINGDAVVNINDLLELISQWGGVSGSGDINADDIIDVSDLLIIVGSWGPCP